MKVESCDTDLHGLSQTNMDRGRDLNVLGFLWYVIVGADSHVSPGRVCILGTTLLFLIFFYQKRVYWIYREEDKFESLVATLVANNLR